MIEFSEWDPKWKLLELPPIMQYHHWLLQMALDEEIPDVENVCRIMYTGKPVFSIEDKIFTEPGNTRRFQLIYLSI